MNTLTTVLIMVGAAAVLLLAAVVADRQMSRRAERRASGEDSGRAGRTDPADAVIDLLNRARGMMQQTIESANEKKDQSS